jgi:glycogen synthase
MAAERPRLVLVTADTVGGVWHYALELARALGERDVRVALAAIGPPLAPGQRRLAASLESVTLHERTCRLEWMSEPWSDVQSCGEWLLELECELRPDIVHLNQYAFGTLGFEAPTLVVAHSCVLSWWQAVHGAPAPESWQPYRGAVERGLVGADCVATPTRAMLRMLEQHYGLHPHALVIPNGRSAAHYAPERKEPHIVSAGRLWDAAKNLAALEAVAPHLPWPIRVAGAQTHPAGGVRVLQGVHALGDLAPEALACELARAAIYALPARYEPFGLTVLEAALSGCALVLGDIPSLREVWGPAALYVPPENHEALRACLQRLIEEPCRRADLAQAARARALAYTPGRMANGYLEAYRKARTRRSVCARERARALSVTGSRLCAS